MRRRRGRYRDDGGRLLRLWCAIVFAFLLAPILIIVLTSFTGGETVVMISRTLEQHGASFTVTAASHATTLRSLAATAPFTHCSTATPGWPARCAAN